MKKYTDTVTCPECDAEVEVVYSPGYPAKTCGPPENCYPEEPDDIDAPAECPMCGEEFSERTLNRWCEELYEEHREMLAEGRNRYGDRC